MNREERNSGIDLIGFVPWGTHFCQFYETPEDLTSTLVPYFKAGLENNEYCLWVTSEPLQVGEARAALKKAVTNLDDYIKKGQIEILDYNEWYTKSGKFDAGEVLQGWVEKEKLALRKGFEGLRLSGNIAWLEKKDWESFAKYEAEINRVIGNHRMIAICTYSLDRCSAAEVIDVVDNHQFALIRRQGQWQLMESTEHKQAGEKLQQQNRFLNDEDGNARNVEVHGYPIFDTEGNVIQMLEYCLDITERKRAEEALRESEEKYRSLFKNMLNGYAFCKILVDEENKPVDFTYIDVNDAFGKLTGLRKEDVIGKRVTEAIPSIKALNPEIIDIYGEVALTGNPTAFEVFFKPMDIWLTISVYSPQKGYFVASFDNITERKRVEEALIRSEQNFRNSLDTSPLGIRIVTAGGELLYANQAILDICGYSSVEELKSVPRKQRYTPESYAEHQQRKEKRQRGESVPSNYEISIVRKDGEIRHLQVFRKEVLWDGKTQFQVLYHDITERKQAEDKLRKSETKYRTLVERLQEGVHQIDPEGKYTTLNEAGAKILGFDSPDEVVGKYRAIDFYYDLKGRQKTIEELRKTGRFVAEVRAKRKDGTAVWVLVNNNATLDEHGNIAGYEGVFMDVTEQKQLEEERQKIERLESIGTLAGGIAHDFNNILTGILGNITLAERHIEPKGKAAERLLEAKKASLRAKDLTQQLLTFARGGAPIKEVASVAALLEESAMFALRGSNVKCEFSLPDNLWPIEIDKGQMSQVITNLVINADEAMPEGGILDIRAENTVIERTGVLPLPGGDYVKITVEDHGVGISKKHLGRIFDPYFTTKQKGTGLGLATVYSIIKNHDGYITVESEPGVGTTFHIYLPALKKPVTEKKEVEEAVQAAFRGKKRILVMDDEGMIREMLSNTLSTAGFEVELASDGKEAIERYEKAREAGQPFGAVIMDLTIPGGMGGKEAIKRLIEIDPDVKAIVSSGYSTDPIMADFRKYGFSAVMTKPYTVGELEKTLRRMLRGKKNRSE